MFECNLRNYTIFLRRLPDAGGTPYLFCYFEYVGEDSDLLSDALNDATPKANS
jgi:L-rhamnose mutarotase